MTAFDIMWSIRKSMDFPQVPIEESHANSEGLRILHHACNHVMDSNDEVWLEEAFAKAVQAAAAKALQGSAVNG